MSHTQTPRWRWSLSLLTSVLAASATAVGMGIYAVAQYLADPSLSPLALLAEHAWHVAALWIIIYGTVILTLHYALLRPVHRIYVHLYGVGTGRVKPLRLRTSIRELAEIVEGINVMIKRMDIGPEGEAQARVQRVAHDLRAVARNRGTRDVDLATKLTRYAKDLEYTLGALHAEI